MQRVSTNATLFYKLFIPIFWIVLVGLITAAIILGNFPITMGMRPNAFKIVATVFFLSGCAFLYWSVMRLKRVEIDNNYVYVTNYFKHLRYPIDNIARIKYNDFLLFKSASIYLKEPGHFGKRITFAPSRQLLKTFLEQHPTVAALVDKP